MSPPLLSPRYDVTNPLQKIFPIILLEIQKQNSFSERVANKTNTMRS